VLFVVQAALLLRHVGKPVLSFRPRWDFAGIAGGVLIAYALVVYPLVAMRLGHAYPAMPTFGVPCPVTIFTFGLLLWAAPSVPLRLLVIPTLWAGVGISAVVNLGVIEDLGLPASAIIAAVAVVQARRQAHLPAPAVSPRGG
jgi:hypothetical protein